MLIRLTPIDPGPDADALVEFLSTNRFPFHLVDRPTPEQARLRVDRGDFSPPDHAAYWIELDDHSRVGFVNIEDVGDPTPTLDLRLAEAQRGRGIGSAALRLATARVFRDHPQLRRIEGTTRRDNAAMRRVFERCGYAKEAHYREAWPTATTDPEDAVGYAILRRDWASSSVTPVRWDS